MMNGKRAKDHHASAKHLVHVFQLTTDVVYENTPRTEKRKFSPPYMEGMGISRADWPKITTVSRNLIPCQRAAYQALKRGRLQQFMKRVT